MASERAGGGLGFTGTVIAGLVLLVVAGVATIFFPDWPSAWKWAKEVLPAWWTSATSYSVDVPGWLIGGVLIAGGIAVWLAAHPRLRARIWIFIQLKLGFVDTQIRPGDRVSMEVQHYDDLLGTIKQLSADLQECRANRDSLQLENENLRSAKHDTSPPDFDAIERSLTKDQARVLQHIANLDGKWTTPIEVSRACKMTNLAAEQCLEQLLERQLLKDVLSMSAGRQFRFSNLGRDFALARGWDIA